MRRPNWLHRAGTAPMAVLLTAATATSAEPSRNSLGMALVEVAPGSFQMGNREEGLNRDLCFSEIPAHPVRITQAYRMAVSQVTVDQFRRFRPGFVGTQGSAPYAAGMTWYDATAFCEWLTRAEGKPYRLPTEAEWEYACRQAESLGLQNLLSPPLEWCLDWFGDYPHEEQMDPLGPERGLARVVRGGCLDERAKTEDYAHAAHRAGIGPAFGVYPGAPAGLGEHQIGFRVVQAPLPTTSPRPEAPSPIRLGVKPTSAAVRTGPPAATPYFRKRHLLPVPPDNALTAAIDAVGMHPSFRQHNHSPALTVCPNGDVLVAIYTSLREYEPEVSLMATRLRFGADEWDMPEPFVDFPGANDHAPMLCTDGGVVRLYWGSPGVAGAFPFQWIESRDHGATWSEAFFPRFLTPPGPHARQPITSSLRGLDGTLYVASDGIGASSVLWASDDDGQTWRDTGGRSAGRHTAYCLLADGSLFGLGGKNSEIDGFMPAVVSRDGGRTWAKRQTLFPALTNNQRPSLLRLHSGRLFFAGDFQNLQGAKPAGVAGRGSYVALSEDEGSTWQLKTLVGTQPHESSSALGGADTLGYSAASQAPNGIIHLITTMNRPCLHFELNEAWILAAETPDPGDAVLMRSTATQVSAVQPSRETFANGSTRMVWAGGVADDGRFLLHGKETRFHPNGGPAYEATYRLGRKVGMETAWRMDGTTEWTWQHRDDSLGLWTQYWPNGRKRAESHWQGRFAHGLATCWDAHGREVSRARFTAGEAVIEVAHAILSPRGRYRREAGGAKEGAPCYVDREYPIASLPPELAGGELVRTANDDDYATRSDYLALDLAGETIVTVCYWAAARGLPEWLRQEAWRRLDGQATVHIAGRNEPYTVLARRAPAGRLLLGGNERQQTGAVSMYFVVLQPATSSLHQDEPRSQRNHPE